MKEMLKSKAIIGFLIVVVGFGYIGGIDNNQKMEYEEINNIVIVGE